MNDPIAIGWTIERISVSSVRFVAELLDRTHTKQPKVIVVPVFHHAPVIVPCQGIGWMDMAQGIGRRVAADIYLVGHLNIFDVVELKIIFKDAQQDPVGKGNRCRDLLDDHTVGMGPEIGNYIQGIGHHVEICGGRLGAEEICSETFIAHRWAGESIGL